MSAARQHVETIDRLMRPAARAAGELTAALLADAHLHALAAPPGFPGTGKFSAAALDRLADIRSRLLTPATGILPPAWTNVYRASWEYYRRAVGAAYVVEALEPTETMAAWALERVRIDGRAPATLVEAGIVGAARDLRRASDKRFGRVDALQRWKDQAARALPASLATLAATVGYRLAALAAGDVVRPEFLHADPTRDVP